MSAAPETTGRRDIGIVTGCVVLAAIYTAAGIAGLQFPFFHSAVTTVWPPSGIALAALLLFGLRLAPGVAIGAFAVNLWNSGSLIGALGVSAGNTLAAVAGAWALTRLFRFDVRLMRLRDMVAFLLVGAAASPLIAATLGPLMLLAGHVFEPAEYAGVWFYWWLGDSLGLMLFTPLILAWHNRPPMISRRDGQAIALIIAQAVAAFLIFHSTLGEPLDTQRATYALLPLAIWLAIAYPLRYIAASNLALFLIAIGETAAGLGPFAAGDPTSNILLLHLFLAVVTFTTYLVAGVNAERIAAAAEARANAERFRNLSDLSADWYWEQDDQFRFTWRAGRGLEARGFALDEAIGKTRWDLAVEDMTEADWAEHKAALKAHQRFQDFVIKRRNKDGELIYISLSGEPIFDADFRFIGYRGIGKDVTLQEQARMALAESEERFRQLAGLTADWYWEQDENLRFISIGESRNFNRSDIAPQIGLTRWELPYAGVSEEQRQELDGLIAERKPFRDFVLTRYKAGSEPRIISTSGYPIFDPGGRFKGYRGIGRDITELKQAERALRRSEERFRSLTELSSDWYWEQDEELRTTYMSPRYSARTGLAMKPTLGQTRFETDNLWESEEQKADHRATLEAHLPFRDLRLARADESGELRYLSISGEPVFDQEGRFAGYRGIGRDLTEQKLAERALRASEERFRSLTELSSDWYWEQDAELRFTFVSSAIDAISGVHQSDRLGKRRWEIPGLLFDPVLLDQHKKFLVERKPFRDFRYTRQMPDGRLRHISITGAPLFDAGGTFTGYRGIGREVTTEVGAEQRMGRLRDFYAALSKVNDAIIHASDEQRLFNEVCSIAVTYGHAIFARICMIDPRTGMVDNVAIAGNDQGYGERAPISIDPERPEGQGPTAIALRTNTPDVSNDIEADPRNLYWRAAMMSTGARSYVVFPLNRRAQVVGSLHIYAAEKNWFDDELVALITELAANISFALDNFAREEERQNAALALRASEQRFRDVAEAAGEFVWENDLEGRFTYVSPRAVDYTGYAAEELVGHTAIEFMPPGEGERIRQWLSENTRPDRSFRGMEHMFLSKSGEVLWMQVSAVSIWDENGKPLGQRGTTRDISELKRSEARISYLATRDPLTELPNRLLFNDRLEQGIIAARRKLDKLGVLFLDLDRFKNINDSLGHHTGDLLLKEVAARMASCIRKGDTLSRLGGDEFVVTLEGLAHAEDAAQVALKIITALRRPLSVGGHTLNTSCSIGISIYPDDAEDSSELMKNADTAMYHAKEQGRNNFQFFSPEMNLRAVERHRLETELRLALDQGQFVLHYQPQADIRHGMLVGMEALIRWQHPQRGLVPPNSFIPVAEESGLIGPIGQWALRTACEQIQHWQAAGLPIVKVAVNISARQFNEPRDFADDVTRLLNSIGLDPRYLELEMTESMLLKNVDENVAVLRKLGSLGTSLAVDDFGTGYSSLAYLKQLPIDTLKIDRTFVRDIESDADDAAIIKAIIAMAHSLDLRVTAEGVETQGQLAALRKLRCDQFQGYLLSPAIPADEFARRFLVPDSAASSGTARARKSGGPTHKV